HNIIACGITNQRETTVLWDKQTGVALYPAITWKDQRVQPDDLSFVKNYIKPDKLKQLTGLELSPVYSASKIKWILENVADIKNYLLNDRLAFGTINSWLIFNLTDERNHFCDHTNANHTLLYSLKENDWDQNLLRIFRINATIIPKIQPNFYNFGHIKIGNKQIPLMASIADQQAGMYYATHNKQNQSLAKLTLGSGIFLNYSLGQKIIFKSQYETLISYYKKAAEYMLEYRFALNGPELVLAIKSENQKIINQFFNEIKEKVLNLKINKLMIDGGTIRHDEIGDQLFNILEKLPCEIFRPDSIQTTALGTAQILRDNNNRIK
ncbi:MAG: FGGY family carbohydrate kinase, partial [Patescibacteria group bacterium]|nr:FGGY family carbohydrate kinase [Patescibacteria group bacterium]